METEELMQILDDKTEEIRDIIEANMPSNGDIEEDCQRLCLLNRLSDFEQYVSGIVDDDLIEKEG